MVALKRYLEIHRIKKIPRFTYFKTNILGKTIHATDSASFLSTYNSIFKKQIFKFQTKNEEPLIIDCGANIGLSVLYFKMLYPKSHIISFEPDKDIFELLKQNIDNFDLKNIELINKAVWKDNTNLIFTPDGADGGMLAEFHEERKGYLVKSVRLLDYLTNPVDFLKVDIEGAETDVIIDSKSVLVNVKFIFVEYHSFSNKPQTLKNIISILTESGFRIYIHPESVPLQPYLIQSNLSMDMQLNIYAVRPYSDKFLRTPSI